MARPFAGRARAVRGAPPVVISTAGVPFRPAPRRAARISPFAAQEADAAVIRALKGEIDPEQVSMPEEQGFLKRAARSAIFRAIGADPFPQTAPGPLDLSQLSPEELSEFQALPEETRVLLTAPNAAALVAGRQLGAFLPERFGGDPDLQRIESLERAPAIQGLGGGGAIGPETEEARQIALRRRKAALGLTGSAEQNALLQSEREDTLRRLGAGEIDEDMAEDSLRRITEQEARLRGIKGQEMIDPVGRQRFVSGAELLRASREGRLDEYRIPDDLSPTGNFGFVDQRTGEITPVGVFDKGNPADVARFRAAQRRAEATPGVSFMAIGAGDVGEEFLREALLTTTGFDKRMKSLEAQRGGISNSRDLLRLLSEPGQAGGLIADLARGATNPLEVADEVFGTNMADATSEFLADTSRRDLVDSERLQQLVAVGAIAAVTGEESGRKTDRELQLAREFIRGAGTWRSEAALRQAVERIQGISYKSALREAYVLHVAKGREFAMDPRAAMADPESRNRMAESIMRETGLRKSTALELMVDIASNFDEIDSYTGGPEAYMNEQTRSREDVVDFLGEDVRAISAEIEEL